MIFESQTIHLSRLQEGSEVAAEFGSQDLHGVKLANGISDATMDYEDTISTGDQHGPGYEHEMPIMDNRKLVHDGGIG